MIDKPGPELNKQIHEILFGNDLTGFEWSRYGSTQGMVKVKETGVEWVDIPPYSTTWPGMQLVVEEMRQRGYEFRLGLYETVAGTWNYWAYFEDELEEYETMIESTAPHAVCMAALKALEDSQSC